MAASVVTTKVHSAAVSTPPRFLSSRTDPPSLPVPYNPPPTSSSKSSRSPPPPPPKPPANRSGPRPVHPQAMPQPSPSESAPITFKRLLRSPFEQTIRSTARSKGKADPSSPPSDGDRSTAITAKATQATDSAKERTGIFKRFETKVTLRRSRKPSLPEHSTHPVPSPPFNDHKPEEDLDGQDNLPAENGKGLHRFRLPGFTSFVSPSLTLASLSSPAVHLSSSPPSSPSSPPPSSSPARPIISPPAPLSPKRPSVANANPPAPSRPRNSHPHPHLPSSPSAPSLDPFVPSSPAPTTPTRSANLEPASPLATPTPASSSRNPQQQRFLLRTPRSSPDHSSSAPSSSPRQASPGSPRTLSPLSPRAVIPRGFASASTSKPQLSAILFIQRDSGDRL
ncbi:hypothetical protein F5148DRAFT_701000 [Russula earlei]|uniref:Uncharacterized protein n=1 Tax=Russula earlei TaxID=71964 RepID=A0ACC0UE43_9AGAM|nr:hypothetical protein F5148DRAFT_701000 [Russula earlei]